MGGNRFARIPVAILVCVVIGFIARRVVNLVGRLYDGSMPTGVPVVIWIAAALNMLGIAALIVLGKRGIVRFGSPNLPDSAASRTRND